MPIYSNGYKGRANRKESASHLRDEFERLEAAFVALQVSNTSYSVIYNHGDGTEYVLIDPANGQMQEVTLTADTLIQVKSPGKESGSESYRLTLIVHGSGFKIINGWGPQTWKDEGNADWKWIYTGLGEKAGALLEFAFDGLAWCCLAFSRNSYAADGSTEFTGTTAMFPLLAHLNNVEETTVLTWVRDSYAFALDIDGTFVMVPKDTPRFYGGRYVKNWIATPRDLQSEAWEEDGATVTTEAGEGQDGGNVDKITFDATNGEVHAWMLLHFGRPAESADPIKFAISFDAKMAGVIASGTCRAVISIMGVDNGGVIKWDRKEFNLDGEWASFGAILDPVTGKDPKGFNINDSAGARTLVKFSIESPSDGLGNPILIENVNVVVLKEGDDENVSLPLASSIGSSLTLAATAGSTGAWDNGTKVMTLGQGEYVDFQDSLDIGASYLCVATRTAGNSADVLMEDDRTYWTAYVKTGQENAFVKDAPFTFQYEGGVFKFLQVMQTSGYELNIYKISDFSASYGTENANIIDLDTRRITYVEGQNIASNIYAGAGYEKASAVNMLPVNSHRSFAQWDQLVPILVSRSEYGVDGRPSHGSVIEDDQVAAAAYITDIVTIPDDDKMYVYSIFIRKTLDADGNPLHPSQFSAAAGGPVTPPSEFVDIKLFIYDDAQVNSANWIDGNIVRINVGTGALSESGNSYDHKVSIDYQNWWQLQIGLTNNLTGNDRLAVILLPAVAKDSTLAGVQRVDYKGYAIVDWAQVEAVEGYATSSIIPGEPRQPDSITSPLDDGILTNALQAEVGDLTSNDFDFDERGIFRNITWTKS